MTSEKLRQFNWTHHGSALAFASIWGAKLRFAVEPRVWYQWDGTRWRQLAVGDVNELAVRTVKAQRAAWMEDGLDVEVAGKAQRHFLKGEDQGNNEKIVKMASLLPTLRVSVTEFDGDLMKIGTQNGEIDLCTGNFAPPNPLSHLTLSINALFDPEARAPRWERFVREVFDGNEEQIDYIQRAFGYSLTGSVEEQLFFICVGEGANGKSTLLNVVREVMGGYAKATPFTTFDAKSRNEQTNDLARLMGARYVTIIETGEESYLSEAKIKQATGGDPITCRFLNKEFFEYVPQYKIWMAANRPPNISGTDHGTLRRPVIIHFNRKFSEGERNPYLQDQLLAERSGILNWLLEGLRKWHQHKLGIRIPKVIQESKREFQEEMDILGQWLRACTQQAEPVFFERSEDLYASYQAYVKMIGHRPKAMKHWGMDMKNRFEKTRDSKGIKYQGISLVENWPQELPVR